MTDDMITTHQVGVPDDAEDLRRPGKLQGRVDAKFNTGEAVALVDGRGAGKGKSRILGLKAFARRSNIVLSASERGCPFADYSLAEIDVKIREVTEHMQAEGQRLRELAEQRLDPGVSPEDSVAYTTSTWSVSPVEENFVLGRESSRALYCLVQYDRLVMLAKGLQYHKVIKADECRRTIEAAGNMVRGLLSLGDQYQYSGCTRADLRERNRVAQAGVKKLIASRLLDPRMFEDVDDIMATFADYQRPGSEDESGTEGPATEAEGRDDPVTDMKPSGSRE